MDDAETKFHVEPADELTPDVLFERRWAMTLVERAMDRLAPESQQGEHPERFDDLKLY